MDGVDSLAVEQVHQNLDFEAYRYDDANRLISITTPDLKTTSYGYDGNGNRTSVTDANNQVTTYQYDVLNRLVKAIRPDGPFRSILRLKNMNKYEDWIDKYFNRYLSIEQDELSKSIVTLHLLVSELSDASVVVYLTTDYADDLPQIRRCFEKYSFQEGLDWIASLEKAYGMPIHLDVDSRIDYVMNSSEVQHRMEEFSTNNILVIRSLLPKICELLDKLVEEKMAERPDWK